MTDSNELVELHFELEIDADHAFAEAPSIITNCIAKVMSISRSKVFYDGVDQIMPLENGNGDDRGLFRGHIPTSKNEIESLVQLFYDALTNRVLHTLVEDASGVRNAYIEIRELYETDQNSLEMEEMIQQQQTQGQMRVQVDDDDEDEQLYMSKNHILTTV